MDWPRARGILLVAFTVVNLILAYSIWGPRGNSSGADEASSQQQLDRLRETLLDRQLTLPVTVTVPRPPGVMRFLRVEYRPTPDYIQLPSESIRGPLNLPAEVDRETKEIIYQPGALGEAAWDLDLGSDRQVQQAVEKYMREAALLPHGATVLGVAPTADPDRRVVEYVPMYDGYPVFSGYVHVEVSRRGIETIRQFWVEPKGYTEAPAKAVRPAGEALLRLAGRLDAVKKMDRTIRDIQLGYYARPLALTQADVVNGWDTVPVWRISLETGEEYYINAFNGEWESEAS